MQPWPLSRYDGSDWQPEAEITAKADHRSAPPQSRRATRRRQIRPVRWSFENAKNVAERSDILAFEARQSGKTLEVARDALHRLDRQRERDLGRER